MTRGPGRTCREFMPWGWGGRPGRAYALGAVADHAVEARAGELGASRRRSGRRRKGWRAHGTRCRHQSRRFSKSDRSIKSPHRCPVILCLSSKGPRRSGEARWGASSPFPAVRGYGARQRTRRDRRPRAPTPSPSPAPAGEGRQVGARTDVHAGTAAPGNGGLAPHGVRCSTCLGRRPRGCTRH